MGTQVNSGASAVAAIQAGTTWGAGKIVELVVARGEHFVIFSTGGWGLHYYTDTDSQAYNWVAKYYSEVHVLYQSRIDGVAPNEYWKTRSRCLSAAFFAAEDINPSEKRIAACFRPMRLFIERHQGSTSAAWSEKWAIWQDKHGTPYLWAGLDGDGTIDHKVKFASILAIARSNFSGRGRRELQARATADLAHALAKNLTPADSFRETTKYLTDELPTAIRALSVVTVLQLALVLALAGLGTFLIWQGAYKLVQGALGGLIGALLSFLLRIAESDSSKPVLASQLRLESLVKLGLGTGFGLLSVVFVEAGLIAGVAKDSAYGAFLIGSVAGLSERFVPDIIKRLASEADDKPKNSGGGSGGDNVPPKPAPSKKSAPTKGSQAGAVPQS